MGSSLRLKKMERLVRSLFPRGFAWQRIFDTDSNIRKLSDALSVEPCRIEDRALEFVDEVYPNTTVEMLPDWERLLGLPDDCESTPESLTYVERIARVIQVLTTRGGLNEQFYKDLAASFGIDIDLITVEDQPPFRAGSGRAGDRITNGDWQFAFIVSAPATEAFKFRAGLSRAGDRLQTVSNSTLECLINKHKPAHAIALFTFGDI